MPVRRTRRSPKERREATPDSVRGAPLEPIGSVERELTRPDGTKLIVQVPVYPPFRLREPVEGVSHKGAPEKKAS